VQIIIGETAMKELRSNKRNISILSLVGLVLLSLLLLTGTASATLPDGVSNDPIAGGSLQEAVRAKFMDDEGGFTDGTEVTDVRLVRFSVEPGGTFGWHQHGGPVWVIVNSGTLSIYRGDDPTCTPQLYGRGTAFLDPGDDTHLGRNETGDTVEVYAIFMLPKNGEARKDVPNPGLCNIN
jgi:quercetin dioxygenase-like cupin family protein